MVTLKNLARGIPPKIPFEKISDNILGKSYTLSVVFIGRLRMQKLNNKYRKKNKTTNILSFPLSDKDGEIFLNLNKIQTEAKKLREPLKIYFAYIFIHGVLHLKGYAHGSTMKSEEQKALRVFGFIKK